MKKLLAFLLVVGFSLTFVACGNQAKEETAAEEAVEDTTEAVEEAAEEAEDAVEDAAEEMEEVVEEADTTEVSE